MTQIMVSRREGVATAPDGTKYRVHRGRTLADARHPLVVAWPADWAPMQVELTVEEPVTAADGAPADLEELEELRNDLAEAEEVRDAALEQLGRIADGLAERGYVLPLDEDRGPGWLAGLALGLLDEAATRPSLPAPPVAPPREPRAAKPRAGR